MSKSRVFRHLLYKNLIEWYSSMNSKVKKLTGERERLRKDKKFEEADKIREQLESLGYFVMDKQNVSSLLKNKKNNTNPRKTFLVLFGSGEMSSVGRGIHEYVFKEMGCKIKIAIITSPAGFQPNVKKVHEEIADFFMSSLSNFNPSTEIVYISTKKDANDKSLASKIEKANYIFMGPGSPTYAVHVLRDSLVYEKIKQQVSSGSASLSLSSAAVLAFSKWCLPVYEIYKVGADLYWEKGLNLYSSLFDSSTFIPHFNNNEGADKTDTARCYMGIDRFEKLLKIFPGGKLCGIDEQTAMVFDFKKGKKVIIGKGKLHDVFLDVRF